MKKIPRILASFGIVVLALVLFYFGIYKPVDWQFLPTPATPDPIQAQNFSSYQFCPGSVEITDDATASYVDDFNPVPVAPSVSIAALGLGSIDSAMFSNIEQTEFNELLGAGSKYLALTQVPGQVLEGIFETDTAGNALSGLTLVSTPEGDLRGLASQNCVPFASEFWFLGGGTKVGQNLQLFIANRDDNPAEVKIEVFTNPNSSILENTKTFQIAKRSIQKILIAQISYDFEQVAIRVTSPQSKIAVAEQIHLLDGFEAQGIDFISTSTFATAQYFPQVSFNNSITTQFNFFSEVDSEISLTFRPSNSANSASIVLQQSVPAKQPRSFNPNQSSAEIATGDYWVEINSDQPFISNVFETYPSAALKPSSDQTQSDATSSGSTQSNNARNQLAELVVRTPSAQTNFGSVFFSDSNWAQTNLYLLNSSDQTVEVSIAFHDQNGLFIDNLTVNILPQTAQNLDAAANRNLGFIVVQSLNPDQVFSAASQFQSQLGITAVPLTPAKPQSQNFNIIYLQ
jgi:hypothetical protein